MVTSQFLLVFQLQMPGLLKSNTLSAMTLPIRIDNQDKYPCA